MIRCATTLALLLTLLTTSLAARASSLTTPLLTGNDHASWMVCAGENPDTFSVYARKDGERFATVTHGIRGMPTSIQAVGDALHVLFDKGQYLVITAKGNTRSGATLPGKSLGLTEGLQGPAKSPALLALVRLATPAKTPNTTKPSRPFLCLYSSFGTSWVVQASTPAATLSDKPVLLAALGETLYALRTEVADDKKVSHHLERMDAAGVWQDVLPAAAAKTIQNPVALLAFDTTLVLVEQHQADATCTLAIRRYTPPPAKSEPAKASTLSAPIAILTDDNPHSWPEASPPAVSRMGQQIALLWSDPEKNGSLAFSLADPATGKLQPAESLEDVLDALPDLEKAQVVLQYYLWGVMIAVFASMLFLRPRNRRVGPNIFSLPSYIRPGALWRRALAAAIDFFPFTTLASLAVFAFQPEEFHRLMKISAEGGDLASHVSIAHFYAFLAAMVVYVFYCIAMEWRFGATLGKKAMGLCVVGDGGVPAGPREVVLRNLLKLVELSMFISPIPWLMMIMVLPPILTRYHQRIGDMVARSVVINAKILMPPLPHSEEDNAPPV